MPKKVTITPKPNRSAGDPEKAAEQWVSSGKNEGPETMKRFTIDVPESLHRRVKLQCAAQGLKMADEIRTLLEKHFPPKTVE
jgi:predicted DNA binding CopG/RHH family protein